MALVAIEIAGKPLGNSPLKWMAPGKNAPIDIVE
jgi:hypothetical protein